MYLWSVNAQNYVGPSPNSMGIVRLANQVSHYTGSPGINIPLVSLPGKELTASVSLAYNSFGHRVQDVAGSVGLGWNLMAVGIITRVVKGEPDDLTGGYCKPPLGEVLGVVCNYAFLSLDPVQWSGALPVFKNCF